MKRHGHIRRLSIFLVAIVTFILSAAAPEAAAPKKGVSFDIAKIYFEYNSSASLLGDLGVHVSLDGEDWRELEIINPRGRTIFEVEGRGPYRELGMTELFFEGAEPDLGDVPLEELLDLFPEGRYRFVGETVDGKRITATARLSHAIPNGPSDVSAQVGPGDSLVISWKAPIGSLTGVPINIVAYQVIVGTFQVIVPATATSVQSQSMTVSPEFVASLEPGEQLFEVLAIEAGGNQTITEGSFEIQ
jgi:hypothetical protein